MKALKKLNPYFLKHKWLLITGGVFVIISVVFKLFPALLIRNSFDTIARVIEDYKSGAVRDETVRWELIRYGLYIIASAVLQGIFMYFMRQTIIVMSRHIEYDLKNVVFDHYQRLTQRFFKKNNTGDLMNRISEDVGKVRMYVGPAIMYTLNTGFTIILVISIMISVSPKLTLLTLIPLPFLAYLIYKVASLIQERSHAVQSQLSNLSTFAQESFSGTRVIKSYHKTPWFFEKFKEQALEYRSVNEKLFRVNAVFQPLMIFMVGLSTLITIFVGGKLYMAGEVSAGNITEFIYYVNLLTWPIASIGWVTSLVQSASASMERLDEFLNEAPDFESGQYIPKEFKGRIVFEKVSFTYPNSGVEALKDVSFELEAGQSLGILGKTGAGKSTVAALIVRQYDPTSGRITIDGVDLKEWNLPALKSHLGWVPQEAFLFSDTIANNIAFGMDAMDLAEVINAAKAAGVHDNISEFPKSYETRVGERGVTLSGGQKQRVSIARALIKKPEIMVFDDCLSAVDTETEEIILRNIKAATQDVSSLIVAHRISSVKHCDQIICLEDGRVIERGTAEELEQAGGHYTELVALQLDTSFEEN
ncbi:MAG: ABC transporter ATP-binding protein [Schleiferiaceae bacterium]|jgi:ATP-binding cassette subfamily B multidrug efflux pump|nr:ABC transporter ATP-binding protein [Bacteroidota bacterium]MDA8641914.1 ABC transporter ATP-binding protein/permease [Schleiferiaceae bacterium]MCH9810544.1 ABC transporter ATP-binding protein/permease [Bacteroidota bacterium]MDA8687199.1 ABC transporter ATP-binding protein/permease [Schleiferiaceae bacterium]MDA9192317.1 ABC transporter ATP-binding protein/permease [Schleiferiaceae bacterium]